MQTVVAPTGGQLFPKEHFFLTRPDKLRACEKPEGQCMGDVLNCLPIGFAGQDPRRESGANAHECGYCLRMHYPLETSRAIVALAVDNWKAPAPERKSLTAIAGPERGYSSNMNNALYISGRPRIIVTSLACPELCSRLPRALSFSSVCL